MSGLACTNIVFEGQYFTLYRHESMLSFLLLLLLLNRLYDESEVAWNVEMLAEASNSLHSRLSFRNGTQ